MNVALITHPDCLLHEMGPGHPESPKRLVAIKEQLIASGLDEELQHFEAPVVTREQLHRVHDQQYVQSLFDQAPDQGLVWLDPDTAMNKHTLDAALRAAGAVVLAVELVMTGRVSRAFCNVRPPGHHAERARAMGFCFFNNIAIGAAHALEQWGLERVAIVDFDVHHGNGTEDIFQDEKRVLYCSTFQHPYYPYSCLQSARKTMVKVPLEAGAGSQPFQQAVEAHWLPSLDEFKPQLVFISAGFDAHADDPLAEIKLTESDYTWVTKKIDAVSQRYASNHIISVLEGGYALTALGRSAVAHIDALFS